MKKRVLSFISVLLTFVLLFSLCGCEFLFPSDDPVIPIGSHGTDPENPDDDDPVGPGDDDPEESGETETIALDNRSLTIAYNASATLTASTENTDKVVVWSVSEEGVITFETDEDTVTVFSGETSGTVVLTATLEGTDISASCTVSVVDSTVEVESVTVDRTEITLEVNETATLSATVPPGWCQDASRRRL